jgi:hypothetical protein
MWTCSSGLTTIPRSIRCQPLSQRRPGAAPSVLLVVRIWVYSSTISLPTFSLSGMFLYRAKEGPGAAGEAPNTYLEFYGPRQVNPHIHTPWSA